MTDAAPDSIPGGPLDEDAGTDAATGRPASLLVAVAVAAVEALALLAYTGGIALSGIQNPGSVAVPAAVTLLYLVFAVGIGLVVKGLWQRRGWARTPFVVIQLFALVTGWTAISGDGSGTHLIGWATVALAAVGLVSAFLRPTGEALQS